MEDTRDYPEHDVRTPKFSFGDKVHTEDGFDGKITQVDKNDDYTEYQVTGEIVHGWYPAHELTHVE